LLKGYKNGVNQMTGLESLIKTATGLQGFGFDVEVLTGECVTVLARKRGARLTVIIDDNYIYASGDRANKPFNLMTIWSDGDFVKKIESPTENQILNLIFDAIEPLGLA
jgi:hypothetical protein